MNANKPLTLDEFHFLLGQTIMYCQIIEGDIKHIYCAMRRGDIIDNFFLIEQQNLTILTTAHIYLWMTMTICENLLAKEIIGATKHISILFILVTIFHLQKNIKKSAVVLLMTTRLLPMFIVNLNKFEFVQCMISSEINGKSLTFAENTAYLKKKQ